MPIFWSVAASWSILFHLAVFRSVLVEDRLIPTAEASDRSVSDENDPLGRLFGLQNLNSA